MEGLTRLVSESLARHGFDRPLDYRRLHWSHWFRCESHHSLLQVPSKPGVFALAEEVMDFSANREGRDFSRTGHASMQNAASAAEGNDIRSTRRMLAVTQFFEDDDMAFVLDRMMSRDAWPRDATSFASSSSKIRLSASRSAARSTNGL